MVDGHRSTVLQRLGVYLGLSEPATPWRKMSRSERIWSSASLMLTVAVATFVGEHYGFGWFIVAVIGATVVNALVAVAAKTLRRRRKT